MIGPIAELWGWRYAFFVLGIPGALLALLVRLTVREPVRGAFDGAYAIPASETTRDVLRYLLGQQVVRVVRGRGVPERGRGDGRRSVPHRLSDAQPRHERRMAGFAYMWVGPLAHAVGGLLGGLLTDRLGQRDARWYMWIPAASALLGLPFTVAFVLWPAGGTFEILGQPFPIALAVILPGSLVGAAWLGPTLAMAQTLARPHMRALASALTTGTYNLIGMGLGPLVVGLVSDGLEPRFGVEALRYGLLVVVLAHLGGSAPQSVGRWTPARRPGSRATIGSGSPGPYLLRARLRTPFSSNSATAPAARPRPGADSGRLTFHPVANTPTTMFW